jgi:hypothetical protein
MFQAFENTYLNILDHFIAPIRHISYLFRLADEYMT